MRFYGLADLSVQEVIEFYGSREEAEASLREVLVDEPEWVSILKIVAVDFASRSEPALEFL